MVPFNILYLHFLTSIDGPRQRVDRECVWKLRGVVCLGGGGEGKPCSEVRSEFSEPWQWKVANISDLTVAWGQSSQFNVWAIGSVVLGPWVSVMCTFINGMHAHRFDGVVAYWTSHDPSDNKMPDSKFTTPEKYRYKTGFGSYQEWAI